MPNHLLIYVIVGLNALSQALLIWRFKLSDTAKLVFCGLTIGIPITVSLVMRMLVATGILHNRVAEQVGYEHAVTMVASMLLIGGPWLVTVSAVFYRQKQRAINVQRVST